MSAGNKNVGESDKALFRTTVDSNTPLDKDNIEQSAGTKKQALFSNYRYINEARILGSEMIAHTKGGVSNKIIKKMKNGNIEDFPKLDLHGQTVTEACESMSQFIYHHQHKTFIQIIHGKGYHSENGLSILKTQVMSFLKQHPAIMAFNSCPDKNGGTGAVFVLLKTYV